MQKEITVFTLVTRTGAALLTMVMLLTVFAGTTLAAAPASESFSFAERGLTARAHWESCNGPDAGGITHCSGMQVFVFDGRQRSNDQLGRNNTALTYLCVYRYELAFDDEGSVAGEPIAEQGCTDDPAFSLVGTLEVVTAAAPALVLTQAVCTFDPETGDHLCEEGSSRTVAVQAEFTGTGSIVSDRWGSRQRILIDGFRCTFSSSGSGISRDATASMTIDADTLDELVHARLSEGKTRFGQKCR